MGWHQAWRKDDLLRYNRLSKMFERYLSILLMNDMRGSNVTTGAWYTTCEPREFD